ncbi:MAG: hypothetical protein JSV62_09135 [Promethearchaeota archaeon]|nr:MAG: hypothetical protein JSV62_09135 [Candidatus Lokiarchaeota archaeon]
MNDSTREESSSLFTSRAYDVNLEVAGDPQDLQFPEKYSFTQHVSELSRKGFFAFFNLVASEALKDNYTDNIEDEFGSIVNVLFQRFKLDQLDDQGSIEGSIKEYILELEKYIFFLPDIFLNSKIFLDRTNYNLSPNESGSYYCDLETLAKILLDVLRLLREEKIAFWKRFLEEYKKDKEGYDLGFRTVATRFNKDLDKFSQITKEDIENTFKNLK